MYEFDGGETSGGMSCDASTVSLLTRQPVNVTTFPCVLQGLERDAGRVRHPAFSEPSIVACEVSAPNGRLANCSLR